MPTVFIVTPDVARARLLSTMLEHRHYHVLSMGTAELATDVMRCIKPDLLLIDMTRPGTDGSSLLTTLRNEEHYTTLPVVVLEPDRNTPAGARFRPLGSGEVLLAPHCTSDQILQYVKNYLGDPDEADGGDGDGDGDAETINPAGPLTDPNAHYDADATFSDLFGRS